MKSNLSKEEKAVIRKKVMDLLRREIPSLAIGSLAMVGSSLSNQGTLKISSKFVIVLKTESFLKLHRVIVDWHFLSNAEIAGKRVGPVLQ